MMRLINLAPAAMFLAAAAGPAFAQLSTQSGGPSQTSIQPRGPAPDIAPPALPGAGDTPGLANAPSVQKPLAGDPTTALFAAVNSGDYNAAQDAVSRGADPNAQNTLGETPLDLSIALNHNAITFMLLSARNEGGGSQAASVPAFTPAAAPLAAKQKQKFRAVQTQTQTLLTQQRGAATNNAGTPDPNAGFLGFSGK